MDKKIKTDKILQVLMVSTVLVAPMVVGAEVKEFGMGISAEKAKLYSGVGVVERVGRYDYLEGM
ncbi:hypothetical protein ACG2K1_00115 [Neisseria sp. 23W00296]|uniref:hypothetical protein n=1 Tax=unclassified Neisseria TaxID=2623750 RepID=UPI0037584A42